MNHQHQFLKSDKDGYEVCSCGTYHSLFPGNPKELYGANYWNGKTRSTFEEQRYNVMEYKTCGISKINKVLQYIPSNKKAVLEIGCSPGEMLRALTDKGYVAHGVEPDVALATSNLSVAPNSNIILGYFPEVFVGMPGEIYHYIIGMDVLEHSLDYDTFIRAAHALLKPDGKAIFMLPIITEDHGDIRQHDYKPDEHVWIFSKSYLQEYLGEIFSDVKFDFWQEGHNMIILTK